MFPGNSIYCNWPECHMVWVAQHSRLFRQLAPSCIVWVCRSLNFIGTQMQARGGKLSRSSIEWKLRGSTVTAALNCMLDTTSSTCKLRIQLKRKGIELFENGTCEGKVFYGQEPPRMIIEQLICIMTSNLDNDSIMSGILCAHSRIHLVWSVLAHGYLCGILCTRSQIYI